MKFYKAISLTLMLLFAVTGILFLAIPDKVAEFFNTLSSSFGLLPSPLSGWSFFLILTSGYMYLVTVLAFLMFRNPGNPYFALLLAQAKLVSSILSLAFFLLQAHYLIYLTNFIVDGAIGLAVLFMYLKMRKRVWAGS
jgi:hypothetical protein